MFKKVSSAALVLLAAACGIAAAQTYPSKPVTMIIPFAAGGPTDVLGRVVGQRMSELLGQQIIVENVGGAGGMVGSKRVADAAPDGYTIVLGTVGTHAQSQTMYKRPLYNSATDFTPVALIAEVPIVLIVRKDLPASNLKEFIAYAKANQGKMQFGSAGAGSATHLGCVLLNYLIGVDITHVPYRGTGPAMQDLLGGQIDGMCDSAPNVIPQVIAGTVRALVVAQPTRIAAVPDVPAAQEAGFANFNVVGWNAIVAPPKTPKEIIGKANAALAEALADPAVRKRIEDLGAIPPKPEEATPQWMQSFLRAEVEQWGKVIRAAGVSVD